MNDCSSIFTLQGKQGKNLYHERTMGNNKILIFESIGEKISTNFNHKYDLMKWGKSWLKISKNSSIKLFKLPDINFCDMSMINSF
jgi:hypothetical protein